MGQFTVTHTAVSGGGRAGVSFKLHFAHCLSNVRITNVLDLWKAKGPSYKLISYLKYSYIYVQYFAITIKTAVMHD